MGSRSKERRSYSPPSVDRIWGLGFRVYFGGCIGIMKKKMETTI